MLSETMLRFGSSHFTIHASSFLCRDTLPLLCPAPHQPANPQCQADSRHLITMLTSHLALTSLQGCKKGSSTWDLLEGMLVALVRSSGRGNLRIVFPTLLSPTQPRSQSILAYLEHLPSLCLSFRQSCAGESSPVRFQLPHSQC